MIFDIVVSRTASLWILKESVLGKWVCPVSHIGQCLTTCWKSRYPNDTVLAEIVPFNFRFIPMGLAVQGLSSLLCACPEVILASCFIRFLLSVHLLWPPPPSHPAPIFSHLTVSPGPSSLYPAASQTAECLPEPELPPLTPCAPLPRPLDRALHCRQARHTAVTASC